MILIFTVNFPRNYGVTSPHDSVHMDSILNSIKTNIFNFYSFQGGFVVFLRKGKGKRSAHLTHFCDIIIQYVCICIIPACLFLVSSFIVINL